MKILKLSFIFFLIISFNHLKANNEDMKNEITKNLRCLICQGQSVYDSDSEFANSLKIMVDKKIGEGLTEEQIYRYFENKYGGKVFVIFSTRTGDKKEIKNKEIVDALELPPIKIHCSVLAEDSIKQAIEDYESKQ